MENKTRSIFQFTSYVLRKIMPALLTGAGIIKEYWIRIPGDAIQPVVKTTVIKKIWLNYSTIVILGSCIGSLVFFVFYCKHRRPGREPGYLNLDKKFKEKTNETKTIKLEIFFPFETGTSIVMCKKDSQIKLGQVGTVVKKLSSRIALVEFIVSSGEQQCIPANFVKAANQSYGEGVVLMPDDY